MDIIGQIIGIAAMVMGAVSFQLKNRKGILAFQFTASCLFAIHYIILGAYTGAALNVVGILRSVVFINRGKKWADTRLWLWGFIALTALACAVTWHGPLSLLSGVGMVIQSVAFWMKSPAKMRLTSIPGSILWEIYNICTHSVGGSISSAINILSAGSALIRIDYPQFREKRKQEKTTEKNA